VSFRTNVSNPAQNIGLKAVMVSRVGVASFSEPLIADHEPAR